MGLTKRAANLDWPQHTNSTFAVLQKKLFTVNGAVVTRGNFQVGNGVVHVIDRVMFPPEGAVMDKVNEDGDLRLVESRALCSVCHTNTTKWYM